MKRNRRQPSRFKESVEQISSQERSALGGTDASPPVDEIGRLYDRIAALASGESSDPKLASDVEPLWTRLRQLQVEEADRFEEAFEASLNMPIDAGARILEEVRALREELENSTASYSPL